MLFSARLKVLMDLLSKHRHFYPPRYPKLVFTILMSLALQRSIKKEDKLYQEKVQDIQIGDDPVFIIGHWRSGTTYLHYLLSLDTESFAYPTNYHCFLPTVFLTISENSWKFNLINRIVGRRTRLIDNMEFTLTSPQEEEWMYLPLGGYSYIFEKLIFPQTTITDFDQIIKLSNDDKTKEITLQIFKKLWFMHKKRILSKSPGHFTRIPLLKQVFHKSKFVFIIRNPYDVVPSMIHAGNVLGKILSLQKQPKQDISSTIRFLKFYFDVMHQNIQILKNNECVLLKYEDLVKDPIKCIEKIYGALDLKFLNSYQKDLIKYLESVQNYQRNQFDVRPEMKGLIYKECRSIFDAYGYEK